MLRATNHAIFLENQGDTEIFTSALEFLLLSLREVLPSRPPRPAYPMTDFSFNTRTCVTHF